MREYKMIMAPTVEDLAKEVTLALADESVSLHGSPLCVPERNNPKGAGLAFVQAVYVSPFDGLAAEVETVQEARRLTEEEELASLKAEKAAASPKNAPTQNMEQPTNPQG